MTDVTDGTTIRRAQAAEAARLGSLIADEFSNLPLAVCLVADEGERKAAMAGQFAILIAHAITYGDVDVVDDDDGEPAGVAVWFRPDEIPEIDGYDERLAEACGPHVHRFVELDRLMHDAHPADPHTYLAFLAVRSALQSCGIGSALLSSYETGLDRDGSPAYLEASSPRSRKLYLRHGFVDHAPPYGLDGGEHFYPMWREPT